MSQIPVTEEGKRILQAELSDLEGQVPGIQAAIAEAREKGDLKENAEYHAAKEAQAMLHARLRDLEDNIARSRILEDQDIDLSKAYVGAIVKVQNQKTMKEIIYTLVSPVEADLASGKISTQSPVGKAILGASEGDVVVAKVPAGDFKLKILDISR